MNEPLPAPLSPPASPPRRGRPRSVDPGERLSTRLPTTEYDRLARIARREGMSLGGLVRQIILVVLSSD